MLTYETDASILTIRDAGKATPEERRGVFAEIRNDGRVRNRALVLLDVHNVDAPTTGTTVIKRVQALYEQLGTKFGPACALFVGPNLQAAGKLFRKTWIGGRVHVGIFSAEEAARKWLLAYGTIQALTGA